MNFLVRPLILSGLAAAWMGSFGSTPALAAEPPNQNDPCSTAGRNTCESAGVGAYRTYRYGIRWFGDYRGAIDGVDDALFCIDLRFWYPSKSFRYEKRSAAGLKNRDGDSVSAGALRQMSYALWKYGTSNNRVQQGAMMLFVHGKMGDAAPGEAAPDAIGDAVERRYHQIAREAERFAGPYTIETSIAKGLTVGKKARVTARVKAASGAVVPDVTVEFKATGAKDLPDGQTTNSRGVASASLTPTSLEGVKVTATADVAAQLPAMYVPTRGEARRSGQRLMGKAATTVSDPVAAPVRTQPVIQTQISEQSSAPGAALTDEVQVSGLAGQSVTVNAALYGPFPAKDAMDCKKAPFWQGTFSAAGDGTYTTDPVTVTTPGYYTYVEWIDETPSVSATKTACGDASETTIVRGAPTIRTQISTQQSAPGQKVTDTAVVSGLGVLKATVNVELWGPYATKAAMNCQGEPFWKGTFVANGDGSYVTEAVTLTGAGYYTYRESIAEAPEYAAVQTECGEATETTIARAVPKVETIVSDTVLKPGGELFDRVKVTGLGKTPATVELTLYGPYTSIAAMDCKGSPVWRGKVEAPGDGTYTSAKTEIKRAGFYVYTERIRETEIVAGTTAKCGIASETSLGRPLILTGIAEARAANVRAVMAQDAERRPRPTRVRMPRLGVDAQIFTAAIDLETGALGVPVNIGRVGWWVDGAGPADDAGTVLLAGHVDSADKGAGAFYAIKDARSGDSIVVTDSADRRRSYRVTSVTRQPKDQLPERVFTRSGPRRVVLVTCGGPFLQDKGRYRDNIVVTAALR